MNELPITVIIPSFNNVKNYKKNLNSIFRQKYANYRVFYFDDCSVDDTYAYVQKYFERLSPEKRQRAHLFGTIRNQKQGCMKYQGAHLAADEDILVFVDGDDWLASDTVFAKLNAVYQKSGAWMTFGNFIIYNGKNRKMNRNKFNQPIPKDVIRKNSYRTSPWTTSHLRTCYAWLYKQIPIEYLLDWNGAFLPFSTDVAETRALVELAGKHQCFIPDILYIYNKINSLKYPKTAYAKRKDNKASEKVRRHIRDMKPLGTLSEPIPRGYDLWKPVQTAEHIFSLPPSHSPLWQSVDWYSLREDVFYWVPSSANITDIAANNHQQDPLEMMARFMINTGVDICWRIRDERDFVQKIPILTPDSKNITVANNVHTSWLIGVALMNRGPKNNDSTAFLRPGLYTKSGLLRKTGAVLVAFPLTSSSIRS